MLLAPSLLAANFMKMQQEFELINRSAADWFHIDVMDGRFVPNITFGQFIIEQMRPHSTKTFDVHLMIVEPEKYIEQFRKVGADVITVHYEACTHLHRTLQQIKATGAKAGVGLNPHTPIGVLEDIIQDIDLVCIMSVNPGFGGQKFIEKTYDRVRKLKALIQATNSPALIEIDGGVSLSNFEQLLEAGADVLVTGSSVFGAENPEAVIATMKKEKTIF